MLIVVVLWTAMPALACLRSASGPMRHSCCSKMAQDCAAMMGASATCCQARQDGTGVAAIPLFSPEQFQELALLPPRAGLALPAAASDLRFAAFEAPPPAASPGNHLILRI